MRGRACDQTGEHARALSNLQVLKRMRIPPVALELRVRRLRLLQRVAKNPSNHTQLLAAVLGRFPFDTKHSAPLTSTGYLKPGANSWVTQWWRDIHVFGQSDEAAQQVVERAKTS